MRGGDRKDIEGFAVPDIQDGRWLLQQVDIVGQCEILVVEAK